MKLGRRSYFKNVQRKRYASHTYRNPYFHRTDARVALRRWLAVVSILLIISFFLWLFASPSQRIQTITIEGTQSLSQEELLGVIEPYLASRRALLFRQNNRWLFERDGLREQLEERYAFEQLNVRKKGRTLTIALEEKASYLLWKTGNDVYVVDLQGTIIRRFIGEENILPLFVDRNRIPVDIRTTVLTPQEIENIFRFHEHLLLQGIGFKETSIDRLAGKWMSVVTLDGYQILFDATGDIDAQARNLEVLLRDTIPDPRRLQYIDLRFGDHVYYK